MFINKLGGFFCGYKVIPYNVTQLFLNIQVNLK